jgi:hypothetical protein
MTSAATACCVLSTPNTWSIGTDTFNITKPAKVLHWNYCRPQKYQRDCSSPCFRHSLLFVVQFRSFEFLCGTRSCTRFCRGGIDINLNCEGWKIDISSESLEMTIPVPLRSSGTSIYWRERRMHRFIVILQKKRYWNPEVTGILPVFRSPHPSSTRKIDRIRHDAHRSKRS